MEHEAQPQIPALSPGNEVFFKRKNQFFAAIGVALSVLSIFCHNRFAIALSYFAIPLISLYLLAVLVSAALLSSKKQPARRLCEFCIPSRLSGLVLFISFVTTLLFLWANIYLSIGNQFDLPIKNRMDAAYFSYVTMATVGYGDIHPTTNSAKLLIMGQLTTSILLFFGAFPLLISRFSTFK